MKLPEFARKYLGLQLL